MRRNISSLFLQYARLDRKRGLEGLDAREEEVWANLRKYLTQHLSPSTPENVCRRASIRVPTEIACSYVVAPSPEPGRLSNLSRSGAFLCAAELLPVATELRLRLQLENGEQIDVPAVVVNQSDESDRRGMGIRFGPMHPEDIKCIDELYQRSIVSAYGEPSEDPDEPSSSSSPGEIA